MAKMCAATNLKWPDALPLVLMSMRNTPDKKTGLSPYEILMGRAMRLPAVPANALVNITDDMVLDYCKGLADVVRSFSHQVEATTLPPISDPGHTLKAIDWVVVKKHMRKLCLEPRWNGPYQVILTTTTAVKMCRRSKMDTCQSHKEGPESIQRGTETEGEPTEDGLIPQTVNKLERGDSEPISAEAAGEPKQREVLPEADGYRFEVEPVTDPEDEGEEAEGGQSALTPPEPLAGPSRENTIAQDEGSVQCSERPSRKKTDKGDNWPEPQAAIEKVVPGATIEEEVDTTRKEDLSKGELQSERRLKTKRVANRRYAGPEWAYATSAEWQQEFLALCFDREVPGQYYGT
ncbi:hypothetical protein NDU88_004068 [Pleurodeles waltl]|uniref:Murine leukemia virus integrase C-terminal domain-containing protein n=1 Tax=Pleurodeles waltl TaxID=8319 RepID=A0AAV7WUS2_PLEWA|nr:hypothetical protein NDU88_004068 [Pleurodeles waltl]